MKYFDAHAHVQFPPYDADREDLLARMREAEVGALMVGVDRESSEKAIALVESRENLYASVGLHPNHYNEEFDVDAWRSLAAHEKVIAIGECGLDNYRPEDIADAKPKQRALFEKHVQLAIELDKPLMIHSRPSKGTMDAYRDLIEILKSYKREQEEKLRGDIHFFVGGIEEARDFIDLGFTVSYTAVITFARDYDEVIRFVPLSSLLAETDCPYLAPASRRGERNDPLAVIEVVESFARVRKQDTELVRRAVLQNTERVFGILSRK